MFDTALDASTNVDKIIDFTVVDDTIELDQSVFTALSLGTLSADAFVTGTSAQDADDRIIYDSATGKIYYDADGNGSGAAVLFGQVTAGTALTNADFEVVGALAKAATGQTAAGSPASDSTPAADPGTRVAQVDENAHELDFILSVEALRNLDPYFNYTGDFGIWSIGGMHETVGTAPREGQTGGALANLGGSEQAMANEVNFTANPGLELAAQDLNFGPSSYSHVDRDYFIV